MASGDVPTPFSEKVKTAVKHIERQLGRRLSRVEYGEFTVPYARMVHSGASTEELAGKVAEYITSKRSGDTGAAYESMGGHGAASIPVPAPSGGSSLGGVPAFDLGPGGPAGSGARVHDYGAGGGSGGGSEPPGGPSPASPSPGGDSPSDRETVNYLKVIAEAIVALEKRTAGEEAEGSLAKGRLADIASALGMMESAAFGEQPTTPMGKFAHRVHGLYYRARERLKPAFSFFKKRRAARAAAKAAEAVGGAGAGGAAAGAGATGAEAGGMTALGAGLGTAAVFAAAVLEFGKAAYAFARSQEDEVRRLAQYGGEQAIGVAVLDAERQLRDIQTAQETGESGRSLTESLSSFEEKLRPIESLITNISNTVAGRVLDILGGILDAINPIVQIMTKIYNAIAITPIEPIELNFDIMERIAKEKERLGVPKWPVGGRGI